MIEWMTGHHELHGASLGSSPAAFKAFAMRGGGGGRDWELLSGGSGGGGLLFGVAVSLAEQSPGGSEFR